MHPRTNTNLRNLPPHLLASTNLQTPERQQLTKADYLSPAPQTRQAGLAMRRSHRSRTNLALPEWRGHTTSSTCLSKLHSCTLPRRRQSICPARQNDHSKAVSKTPHTSLPASTSALGRAQIGK